MLGTEGADPENVAHDGFGQRIRRRQILHRGSGGRGRRQALAHTVDEHIPIAEVAEAAEIYAAATKRLLA